MSEPSWTILPTRMKQGRSGCAAVVDYNGDIVITGGYNQDGKILSSIEVFDTHNQMWRPAVSVPPMPIGRSYHSLVALKSGRILVALGGIPESYGLPSSSTSVELLILENHGNPRQWIPMPSMQFARSCFGVFATITATKPGILVVGGMGVRHEPLDTMEFLQEPSEEDLFNCTLAQSFPSQETVIGHRVPHEHPSGPNHGVDSTP